VPVSSAGPVRRETLATDLTTHLVYGTTTAAGLPGLMCHFRTRDELLIAIQRHLTSEWEQRLLAELGKQLEESTAQERAAAYARVNAHGSASKAELAFMVESATSSELAPAMTLIGLGMGATFSTIYDTAIGDIDPAEAGSASGSLSSIQQLANAIGPAVITTVYFGALAGGPAHAMTLSLLTIIAIGVVSCLAIPLLPRHAQPAPH